MNGDIDTTKAVRFKHDLSHLVPVGLGVHRGLSQENLASLGIDLELFGKGVVPEMFHVCPVLDNTVLHRLGDLKEGTVLCGLVTDHQVLDGGRAETLLGTENWTTDNGWEDCSSSDSICNQHNTNHARESWSPPNHT